jgi:hypothetical protein
MPTISSLSLNTKGIQHSSNWVWEKENTSSQALSRIRRVLWPVELFQPGVDTTLLPNSSHPRELDIGALEE